MKSLFDRNAPQPVAPATPTTPKGWAGLSGGMKIGLLGLGALGIVVGVVLPGFGKRQTAPVATAQDQHQQGRIVDYDAPPPVQDVVARVTTSAGPVTPPAGKKRRPPPSEMALYAPVIAPAAAQAATTAQHAAESTEDGLHDPDDKLGASLNGATHLATMHATLVRNADFLIRAGDVIPCLPIEALNSSRPGFTSCRVPEWYRGTNQRRGLIPPGTRIFGQIRSGLAQGEERLGVLYTQIQTPRFSMQLAAPGADSMGRAGLDGDVNTFFWQKAGAVALYALMDVAIGAGQNAASSALSNATGTGGQTLNLGNQAQGLASQQFGSTIHKAPVLTRNEALPIAITVGQDLDFTDACKKAMQYDPMACPLL